ncbi:heat-inducible transcriptional repressor HrcA [Apilactobacillus micheneri]|uniref:Heat-inducible transcription repressor HrcA n=1 Tax=Apilactobacillus micheneri TaxID=1899430 RepID=A0A2S2JIV3_9LACO|nr:heat-inducible transcriptional repressor HrcA [Apilactobacillus micheneri]TPR40728.1 heat-inducible transcriptional repressor HrcA [Apilactobacillus micheneri]TPR42195.1 heat-inducible transcriptional repressor HrcA [Apilactobacillus micheneri]TPR44850.1 heat-inducible transcriptional repressor HrcA [Apilactobacillus micheneri]TPR45149.1 heat-inducible transcriptional repressor HrcA [Apilactobacillus micheneri]TPR46491.1 heat-inducible transcriptional repressor HrcA [Apilactobacillus michen
MLSERQKTVLEVIVSDYTKSGVPVGSKALSNQLPIHVSSATVRNDMAYLEKVGLISKTHSSSGRIPSIEGYRYYVDNLLNPNPIDNSDIRIIKTALGGNFGKIDEIVEQSANILSNLTNYTALALKPEQQVSRRLRSFHLVPLGNRQVMAILITDSQDVINQIFHISDDINGEQLDAVVRLINDKMVGKSLSDILKSLLKGDFTKEIVKYINNPKGILATLNNILTEASKNQFYIGGELNLLSFTDNNDISYLKPIYSLLNDTDDISQFINNSGKSISVKIGPEISNSLLKDYSVITGTYDVGEYGKGVVAVLGPTRMPYSRIIGIVESFRDELSKKLLNYYNKYDQ